MGLRSSRLMDYDEAKSKQGFIVAQLEAAFDRLMALHVPANNRYQGDIYKYTIKQNTFYDTFVAPIFPAMPESIVQRLFLAFSDGSSTLTLKDIAAGIVVLRSGSPMQKLQLLVRCYDPKSTGSIPLKTIKRVSLDVDPLGRRNEATSNLIAAARKTASGTSGYDDVTIKEFYELAREHSKAPAIAWLDDISSTIGAASCTGSYRYGSLIHKQSPLAVLRKSTSFSDAQIEALRGAVQHIRTRYSRSGFVDAEALTAMLSPPYGFVPPLVLRQIMRHLDSTNTGTLSLREFVLGLARFGFDRASDFKLAQKFIFDLFADQNAVPMSDKYSVPGARSSAPHINAQLTKQGFRQMIVAFGIGASDGDSEFGGAEDDVSPPASPMSPARVQMEEPPTHEVDSEAVNRVMESAFPTRDSTPEAPEAFDLKAFVQWELKSGATLVPALRTIWTAVFVEFVVRPSTPGVERAVIESCMHGPGGTFDPTDPGEIGTTWFMIPTAWWLSWRHYTDPDSEQTNAAAPGPMNNDIFFLPLPPSAVKESAFANRVNTSNLKKPGLRRGRDYELVNSRTFNALNAWYCRGRCRSVPVTVVPSCDPLCECDREVEVYQLRLAVVEAGAPRPKATKDSRNGNPADPAFNDAKNPPRLYTRQTSVRQLLSRAKQYYRFCQSGKVPLTKTRLLMRADASPAPSSDSHGVPTEHWVPLDGNELPLADLGIQDLTLFMLDFKIATPRGKRRGGARSSSKGDSADGGGTAAADDADEEDDEDGDNNEQSDEIWMHDFLMQREAEKASKRRRGDNSSGHNGDAQVADAAAAQRIVKKKRRFYSRAYPKRIPGVVGLKNMGNTCYMNASLQCIAACRLLRQYFLNDRLWSHDLNTSPTAHRLGMGGKLAVSFSELLHDMFSEANAGAAITPKGFKKTIGQFNRRFKGYQQQDAQELISTLLGGLHEDLNRIHDKPYNDQPDSNNRSDDVVAMEWWRNHLRRDLSVITALFTGQFKSSLTCQKCQYESSRFEPFSFLPVPLPETPKRFQRVMVHCHDAAPLQLSLSIESNCTIKDIIEGVLRTLQEDLRMSENSPPVHRAADAASHDDVDPLCEARFEDLIAVEFDGNTIGDILPLSSSVSGFSYEHSVINICHVPLLGEARPNLDLTVSRAGSCSTSDDS